MPATTTCRSGKRRFGTERAAADRLAAILDDPPDWPFLPSGYRWCRDCRGHHLTSKPEKKPGDRTRRRVGAVTTKGRRR